MTYEQPQYNELLNMLASPAVIVRDGTVISANGLAKDKYCKADGAPVIVQISDSEAEIDGELYGFASILTDGTELYLSKDTVFIDRMKEFMTNINSPLREVVGTSLASLRLIEQKLSVIDHSVKREVSMFMNMLRKSQFRLIRAVENITEAMEQDKERENIKHIDFYAIDIRNLMVSLITSIKALFKENELNIEYRDDFSGDVIIAGNPIRIESMIVNLLSNAILHSSPVGSPIEVILSKRSKEVEIDIINFGSLSGDARSLFRFYEQKNSNGGIGVGLPAALKIARLHGGNILISTGDGKVCITATLSIGNPDMKLRDVPLDYGDEAARRIIIGLSEVLHWDRFGSPFLDV